MLQFVLGGSKSGKTTLITEKIVEICKNKSSKVMLIVPEQFTFEAEKTLFKTLGGELFRSVKVISFTRMASEIFKLYGTLAGKYADECAKTIIMDRAIEQIYDELELYKKLARNRSFAKTMLDTITELKNAGVSPEELNRSTYELEESNLKLKLKEIALIYGVYDAILLNTYLDPLDDIMRATKILEDKDYFKGYTVIFDEFKGFTSNEKGLIKMILKKSENIYVSLCLDLVRANESEISVFSSVYDTYNDIMRYAREVSVKLKPSIALSNEGYCTQEIMHIEENIFSMTIKPYDAVCENVVAMLCKNEYDEVDYVLSTICKLVKENGYHYNDIAIISRDLDSYISQLEAAFSKYNISFYTDKLSSIANKPLIRFVQNLLSCVTKGYTSENILGMLKCEMTRFSIEEIAELENYVYIWDIKSKQWQNTFILNPRGYKESITDDDNEILERINTIREFINDCIGPFKFEIKDANGIQFCTAIVNLLEKIQAKEKTEEIIKQFLCDENFEYAQEYSRVWEILMELLDTLAMTIGDGKVNSDRFQELFTIVSATYDMGTLPQAIDTVIVGSADRIRTTEKKVVFVLGANESVFPLVPASSGVFTDKERKQLINIEINIAKPSIDKMKEERFIAYKTLTSPCEKLYITARKADISGTSLAPSIIFSQLKKMFGEGVVGDTDDIDGEYFCQSKQTAFAELAKTYFDDTKLSATLKAVLSQDDIYKFKLEKLEKFYNKSDFIIENKSNASLLFGKEMNISPTRVDGFYQCHFRYFCEHGLRAYPLKKAELNPLETGTLIHNILYIVTKQVDLKNDYDEKVIKTMIKSELDRYIEVVMGGVLDKTKRFIYLYNRMRMSIFKIVERLHYELLQSEFTPCGFEYEISDNADITPLKLFGNNETIINVAGKIDRVDSYTNKKGEKFIRIVDYKSGKKEFDLNDVLYGLNLQMLIYLHCISQNGKGEYENSLPAGILYMPAGESAASLPRNAGNEVIKQKKILNYKMNGLLIDDREVLGAMETPMNGLYIPVSEKVDGSLSASSAKSLVSIVQLSKINKYIDSLIVRMADELHDGRIEAVPVEKSCSYCNYQGVCGINKDSKTIEYLKLDNAEILGKIEQEVANGES
ncbi:MAG: PD-(D/E)XK nuclease family protein [Oscillospiraceae bacterium]